MKKAAIILAVLLLTPACAAPKLSAGVQPMKEVAAAALIAVLN